MKVKLDYCKNFNESRQYNKYITYKSKQTYNSAKEAHTLKVQNLEKKKKH
jgi:hypothetical protein